MNSILITLEARSQKLVSSMQRKDTLQVFLTVTKGEVLFDISARTVTFADNHQFNGVSILILMYHKVDVVTPSLWWVSVDRFEQQIRALLDDYQFVFLDDYMIGSNNQVVVTFDDGYENIFRHAFPVLKKFGLPFEIFINAGLLGQWNNFDIYEMKTRFCSQQHLLDMAASHGRIQWHTWKHAQLHQLGDQEIAMELTISQDLRSLFPDPHFGWFAYPSDMHDARSVEMVRQRFRGALAVVSGSNHDRYLLNRVPVFESWWPDK